MKTRDPVFNLLREFLGDPQSIPSLKQKPAKPPEIPLPRKTPEIPMMLWPPAFDPAMPDDYNPFIPRVPVFPSPGPFPGRPGPGISPTLPPGLNPFIPPVPIIPDHAPPAVPDRPPTVGSAQPLINPAPSFGYEDGTKSQSSKTGWMSFFGNPQGATAPAPPVSDVPHWLAQAVPPMYWASQPPPLCRRCGLGSTRGDGGPANHVDDAVTAWRLLPAR